MHRIKTVLVMALLLTPVFLFMEKAEAAQGQQKA